MKKFLYLSFFLSFCLHFANAQNNQLEHETSSGISVFWSDYNVPKELAPASDHTTAISLSLFAKQLVLVPIKKRLYFLTGIGLNGYLSGIKNGHSVLETLEYIPSIDYTPTKIDSISSITSASYEKTYIAVPLSFRFVLSSSKLINFYAEFGVENEFLISSNTSISLNERIGNSSYRSNRRENGPIVDFYTSQINKYAVNVFGTFGLGLNLIDNMIFGFSFSYQRSLVERNKSLTGMQGIMNSYTLQYFFTR